MSGVNKAVILGNLGKDPEVKQLPSGATVCNFSIATSETWKDKTTGEKKEQTEWHNIDVFGKLAEICGQYLKKGSKVYIEGSIHTRKWQDQSGADRYSTSIKAREMQILDRKGDGAQQAAQKPEQSQAQAAREDMDAQAQPTQSVQHNYTPDPAPVDFDDEIPF